MDLAKQLVRSCVRAFYQQPTFDVRHVLVIDALVIHSALRDDDLAYLLSMTALKDLHKLCAKLRDDRFLAIHVRSELKEGSVRPVNRTYYYIDYRQTIDFIKWRVYRLGKDMQVPTVPANERKEYVCPRCKADYTQLEVLDNVSAQGFLCQRCNHVLNHEAERTSAGHEKVTRLNNQLKFITDLLLRIDSVVVPDNNFEFAIQSALPVVRDAQHQVAKSTVVEQARPTSVKGLADTGPKKIDINISNSEGPTEEEKEAERLRKEKLAKQNELPEWMSSSTVNGASFSTTGAGGAIVSNADTDKQTLKRPQALDETEAQKLSSYMENLKREQAALAAKQDESSDDEDDEGDFEDVVATPPLNSSLTGGTGVKPAPSPLRQSSVPVKNELGVAIKREADTNGSGIKRESPGSEDRPAKKVKVEEPAEDDGDDDEDDMEFEDV
ncbi:transcription initiation factor iie subunit alpha [Diaporthe eres]|uniref:HTH TFE/IIEalpha-type domain-containing protein n=1 Tax=Diaporthe vaccinii TaxID=105482 RepID=A0ABR4EG61_9PEZI|nr:transcription initiation factor iie subunit alpha [Diaporthe eres]